MTKDEDFYRIGKVMKSISDMIANHRKRNRILVLFTLPPPLPYLTLTLIIHYSRAAFNDMRIVDVLIRHLIENAVNLDQQENIGSTQKSSRHLTAIVKVIQSCGICFSVWENTTKDGMGNSFFKKS